MDEVLLTIFQKRLDAVSREDGPGLEQREVRLFPAPSGRDGDALWRGRQKGEIWVQSQRGGAGDSLSDSPLPSKMFDINLLPEETNLARRTVYFSLPIVTFLYGEWEGSSASSSSSSGSSTSSSNDQLGTWASSCGNNLLISILDILYPPTGGFIWREYYDVCSGILDVFRSYLAKRVPVLFHSEGDSIKERTFLQSALVNLDAIVTVEDTSEMGLLRLAVQMGKKKQFWGKHYKAPLFLTTAIPAVWDLNVTAHTMVNVYLSSCRADRLLPVSPPVPPIYCIGLEPEERKKMLQTLEKEELLEYATFLGDMSDLEAEAERGAESETSQEAIIIRDRRVLLHKGFSLQFRHVRDTVPNDTDVIFLGYHVRRWDMPWAAHNLCLVTKGDSVGDTYCYWTRNLTQRNEEGVVIAYGPIALNTDEGSDEEKRGQYDRWGRDKFV